MEDEELDLETLKEMMEEVAVVRVVNLIISQAIRDNASAIHIDPGEQQCRVRYRVDGTLYEVMTPPRHLHAALVGRIKVMSLMDIAQRRIPQYGSILLQQESRDYRLRVTILPCALGERTVFQIEPQQIEVRPGLDQLGLRLDLLEFWRSLLQGRGLLMVSGLRASGKGTALRASLASLDGAQRSLMSIEDPIRYPIPGVAQVELQHRYGLDLGCALRGALHSDVEVIMVGELRGTDACLLAVDAACAGCLVLAGTHSSRAAGAVERLCQQGVERYLVAQALRGSLHQRLLRRLCTDCRQAGCKLCRSTGYRGVLGIQELLLNSPALSQAIIEAADLHEAARREGMISLEQDGQRKVEAALTSQDELLRALR
ncbi:Flp pilus assembly complex ATPase component TadA [bacterium]|nr:Flp pilus assembly complex ATPase component TadA [bacterium]